MLALILGLAVVGVVVYLIESMAPKAEPFKVAIQVIVLICVVVYLVRLFGLDIAVPRL